MLLSNYEPQTLDEVDNLIVECEEAINKARETGQYILVEKYSLVLEELKKRVPVCFDCG